MKKIPMGTEEISNLYDELYRMKEKLERMLNFLDTKLTETMVAEKAEAFRQQKEKAGTVSEEHTVKEHTVDAMIRKYYSEEFK